MSDRELHYLQNPFRERLAWGALYVLIATAVITGLYMMVGLLRTHTIPIGQVELSVPYSKYLVGENITFTVKNNFNSAIYALNNCPKEPLGVYRLDGSKWVRIHDQASIKDCPNQDRRVSIPANSSMTVSMAPWKNLFAKPGKYRVVVFVEYYNALPHQDFEVITPPPKAATSTQSGLGSQPRSNASGPSQEQTSDDQPSNQNTPATTYTVHVNSAGNYDVTDLTLNKGDSITFIYSPPYQDEVRTRFSPASVAPITLDAENTSRTITLNSVGTWTFKADDHSGNTGRVTVK